MMQSAKQWAKVLAVVAAMCSAAPAQVSLSSAVDLALRNDPRLKAAQMDVVKARSALAQTHDAYVPNASVTGGYGDSTGVPLSVPVVFSLSSSGLLFNFSQRDYTRAAELGVHSAQLSLQDAQETIAEDVAQTYVHLDSAQRTAAALGEESAIAQRLVTIVQQRLDAGQDTRIELLKAKRTAAQVHLQQLQAEDEAGELADHLARLLGVPAGGLSTLTASIPPLPSLASLSAASPRNLGLEAAQANAASKQETAFGDARYLFRPQITYGANYSRISTSQTDYVDYYPGFRSKSNDAASIGIQIQIPLFDLAHRDRARSAEAEAAHDRYEAQIQSNTFLEGHQKLTRSATELEVRGEIAQDDSDLAQAQLDAVTAQLSAANAATGQPLLTPKDEQNARLQASTRLVDLIAARYDLAQAEISLLRQTGRLDAWLHSAVNAGPGLTATPPTGAQP